MKYHEILAEISFETPWKLQSNTPYTNAFREIILNAEPTNNGKHLHVWQKSDDPTQMISRDFVDGYWEIHHTRVDWQDEQITVSGRILGGNDSANIGFYSTIISLYADLINRGLPVKILSDNRDTFKKYNTVLEKIIAGKDNLIASEIKQDSIYNQTVYYRTIVRSSRGAIKTPLNEAQIQILKRFRRENLI